MDRNCQCFSFQPLAAARLARRHPHKLFVLLLHRIRTGLPVSAPDIFHKPFELHIIDAFPALSAVVHLYFPVRAVNQHIAHFFGQLLIRRIQVKPVCLRQRL